MKRFALTLIHALAGCRGTIGYYVANVYTTPNGLVVQRCQINGNKHETDHGAPDPDACRLEPVGPAPVAAMPAGAPPAPVGARS
jgi:hypothetical protein